MTLPYFRNPYRQGSRGWLTEQYCTLSNFAGGLNNVEPDTTIGDNEATDCRNMRFIGGALMEKRPGTSRYDETNYPDLSDPITWMDTYSPTLGDSKIVRATSKEVYIGADKICDVEGDIRGVTYVGKYYFVDGKALRVYDGKATYRIICAPIGYLSIDSSKNTKTFTLEKTPEQLKVGDYALILSSVAKTDNNLTGTVTAISENNVTLSFSVANSLPKNSAIYFFNPGDVKAVEGTEVWDDEKKIAYYLPCLNELADTYQGDPYMPDSPNVIVIHKNRLFISGSSDSPHSVHFSTITKLAPQPLYFASLASLEMRPDGEAIVDMVVFDDTLVVGRHKDMYVIYGSSQYIGLTDDPFRIKQMDVTVGFMSSNCGAMLNNYYIYLGYDGRFYKLNTPTTFVEYLMTRPIDWKCDIYSSPFSIPQNAVVKTSSVAYRNEVYININDDLTIVYNYDNMAFTYFTGWKSCSLHTLGTNLLVGRTDGIMVKYNDDIESYADLDTAIDACYETKRYDFGSSINYKYFKSFMVTSHAYDETPSTISINVEIDYFDNPANSVVNSNIARFGTAQWGKVVFNNRNLYKSPYINLDVRGRTIKYKFHNDLKEPFRIYDINTLYTIRDVR